MTNSDIILKLNKEQALGFFDFISGIEELQPPIYECHAEELALWALEGQLQKYL
jgi:hypothetical protein